MSRSLRPILGGNLKGRLWTFKQINSHTMGGVEASPLSSSHLCSHYDERYNSKSRSRSFSSGSDSNNRNKYYISLNNSFCSRSVSYLYTSDTSGNNCKSSDISGSNSIYGSAKRGFHVTSRNDSGLIAAGAGLLVAAYGVKYAHEGYVAYQKSRALNDANSSASTSSSDGDSEKGASSDSKDPKKKNDAPNNSFWYSSWFAKNFYDGGFDDKMTKREAALILGIREGADEKRVKEAYLRILRMNHPDHGGSAYIATKLNEAKEIFDKDRPAR